MLQKITIGLTYTGTTEKHNNYVNWLKGNDDIEVIKLSADDDNLLMVNQVDAVVLSGGVDAHPKTYGNSNTNYLNAPEQFNESRDAFETAVFNISQQLQIPVLGVCRGMQLINCILGGDMVQDIGSVSNSVHRNDGNDKIHSIQISANSLLRSITEIDIAETNSAHHQAINHIGKGLNVNAISEDGIIEGIEWTDKSIKPFMIAVQWHPERMYKLGMEASPLSINIRNYFIKEIIKNKTGQ